MNEQEGLSSLDIITVMLAYINLHTYEQSIEQNKKLDTLIYDIEKKLDYQDRILNSILERIEKNGK